MVRFLFLISIAHGLLASSTSSDSLAKRRNFSSPQVLDLDLWFLVEEKIITNLREIKNLSEMPITNKQEMIFCIMQKYDDELNPVRHEMNLQCITMLNQLNSLKKVKIVLHCSGQINFEQISNEMTEFVNMPNNFQKICQDLQDFKDKYFNMLKYDISSEESCDQFKTIINQCDALARKYNFSKKNIPVCVRKI